MRRPHHGFTVIELLVTITIVGVLAAILFPVFSRAREQGRKTTCASQLKQLGVAVRLYVDDWKRLPIIAAQPSVTPHKPRLTAALAHYSKSDAIYRCPTDSAYYLAQGSSYGWVELFDGLSPLHLRFMSYDLSQAPCLLDAEAWHGASSPQGGKNGVWYDGHVKFIEASGG